MEKEEVKSNRQLNKVMIQEEIDYFMRMGDMGKLFRVAMSEFVAVNEFRKRIKEQIFNNAMMFIISMIFAFFGQQPLWLLGACFFGYLAHVEVQRLRKVKSFIELMKHEYNYKPTKDGHALYYEETPTEGRNE